MGEYWWQLVEKNVYHTEKAISGCSHGLSASKIGNKDTILI